MQEKNNKKPLLAQVLIDKFLCSEESKSYNISSSERWLLAAIANRIGVNNTGWPSQEYLSSYTGLSISTIHRSINNLISKNLILVIKKWKNNVYSINIPSHVMMTLDNEIITGHHDMREPLSPVTMTGDHRSPRPPNISIEELNKENNSLKEKKRPKRASSVVHLPIILPDWIDNNVWSEFLQHRKKLKAPMSEYAQKLAINKLEKLRGEGFDVTDIIHTSIYNGWKGLFPPNNFIQKENQNGKPKKESLIEMHWRLNTQGIRKEPSSERDITPSESGAYKKDIYDF